MSTDQDVATKSAPAKATSQSAVYSEMAIGMMRTLHVVPSPVHYSVFFAVASGQPMALVKEIDKIISEKRAFTDEVLQQLYMTHLGGTQAQAVEETAAGAKRILSEIMQNVTHFAGETQALGKEVSQQLQGIDEKASEDMVRSLAQTLIQGAQNIQNSSETMAAKLAEAEREVSQLRENLAIAVQESERDFLTGVFNRKAFDRRLGEAVAAAEHERSDLALLMIDIDHFKAFNDNFGHLIGDEVLKIVAKTLVDTLKGMDCIARYGGEEFAVILPKTHIGGAMIVAEAIRKSIAGKELKRKATGEHFGVITVSIGAALFRFEEDSAVTLIARADEALYRSKKAGRNRVTQENISH